MRLPENPAAALLGAVMVVVAIVLGGAVIEVACGQSQWFWESTPDTPTATATPTPERSEPTGMPALIDDTSQPDDAIQDEWYCWNTGPLAPHRLGYHVPNDHLCTWGELRSSGFAWTP